MPLPNDIKEKLNQANPNTLPDAMRELKMGTYLEELEGSLRRWHHRPHRRRRRDGGGRCGG